MKIVCSMPAFNEEGISEFIREIYEMFTEYDLQIIVINDGSTTSMETELYSLREQCDFKIEIIKNSENLGHGPSTIIGLRNSMKYTPDVIITVDGDGQFRARDIKDCFLMLIQDKLEIVEGCRISRSDPQYRKVSSLVTRLLVKNICGKIPRDANTPLRVYKAQQLQTILDSIDSDLRTPNLYIAALSRIMNFKVGEIEVISITRRGKTDIGTTWNQKYRFFPSCKFLKFCIFAIKQWFFIAVPNLRSKAQL